MTPKPALLYIYTGIEDFLTGQKPLVFKLGQPGSIYTPKPRWNLLIHYPPPLNVNVVNCDIGRPTLIRQLEEVENNGFFKFESH
jgi:hypothetical protein